jgi:hypothetical protein
MCLLCTSLHILQTAVLNYWYFKLIITLFYYSQVNVNQKLCYFLNVEWFRHTLIVSVFLLSPFWRWPHEWSKHVGHQYAIKVHPQNLDTFFGPLIYLIDRNNARGMEHIKRMKFPVVSCHMYIRLKYFHKQLKY